MINLTQISYMALAPISVFSECLLLYGFYKLREFKAHPEVLIYWQCLSQLVMDIHWFTGIEYIRSSMPQISCMLLGSFSVYFYFLSWDYTVLLSIEILLKIRNPHETKYKQRRFWYHTISHATSFIIFLFLIFKGDNNGKSIMKTCFVQARSLYELIVFIPVFIHFPICVVVTVYTIYISYNTFYLKYLKYNILVVIAFSIAWIPIGLVHGLSYNGFDIELPFWFLMFAVLLGGPSGGIIFCTRMMQKGLFKKILKSIFMSKQKLDESYEEYCIEKLSETFVVSYSEFFTSVTVKVIYIKAIADIIVGLANVLMNSENSGFNNQAHRQWNFTIKMAKETSFTVIQYNIHEYKKVMDHFKLNYHDIAISLSSQDNFIDIETRCENIGGKSGAFFYYTSDKEFILKTVTKSELQVLKIMTEGYAKRITSSTQSYLAKIFGAFKIQSGKTKPFRVILMENLSSRMRYPLIFDLKGSQADRRVTHSSYRNIGQMPRTKVYKDIDFFNVMSKIQIDKKDMPELIKAIKLDTKLLQEYFIMDYSLLVIMQEMDMLRGSKVEGNGFFNFDNYLVHIGIIDFLQTYNTKKKIESKYKTLKVGKRFSISAISPQPYRKRFLKLFKSVFTLNMTMQNNINNKEEI
ncbi:hypothetical protein SteCoe_25037 [Stentor coeruleus]|uniref:PIPK domain-containing protein n=1 Tax=Stentor coeruleus TaxID=5963 RepID=A0A1R2BG74_9CILI|nr:hypothetical protein SteCoe_25037 [Stentor coeruleus]